MENNSQCIHYRIRFTRAGEILHMTQPAVSRAISNLESDLDVTLMIRDRKNGIILTDIGKRVLVQLREILKGFEKMEQEIAAEKGLEIGTIRIGAFPTASAYFLPKIIRTIQQNYPNLEFDLYEGTINEVEKWLASRVIDVGIITLPNEDLEILPLYKDKMVAVLRDDHPLQDQPFIRINDLDNEPLIICKGGNELPIIDTFNKTGTNLQVKFVVHNTSALLNMIQEGLGLAILSELSLTTLPPNVHVRELEPQVVRDINLAIPSLKESSLAVQLFIKTAQELFGCSAPKK
ncbi:LysR family transcriptional regulator [Paenibacillus apiarius]|uniref:LysR family transcriptional regulator n=1 Tax=Paenibacillus apiarius TaxID=46240 RepID=A0ABT4DVV6_9BACL|nr:LysR family transcriptional regulator [Paenibacillus apiarius]MCY9513155.1 LysR family transcriptional regulator [Paenibacillus apiarius]MCY9521487.1 LysR family transcriptional regulator [Paenibacillus apiarius]MCY9551642.1 LysR family transcriptional regulator [Paenibacillus apiarius]MCY9560571.1 LysR family transcriptional regulator [Paenibacillus apiarius]MCY9685179.1 LysR family transcriptional regulator [Paenibacillus apiarius]